MSSVRDVKVPRRCNMGYRHSDHHVVVATLKLRLRKPPQGEYEEVRVLLKLGFPRMFTSDASEGFLCRDKTLSLSLMKRWKMTRMH